MDTNAARRLLDHPDADLRPALTAALDELDAIARLLPPNARLADPVAHPLPERVRGVLVVLAEALEVTAAEPVVEPARHPVARAREDSRRRRARRLVAILPRLGPYRPGREGRT